MAGRFLSTRDNNFFHKVNKELLGDSLRSKEGIINQEVTIYQLMKEKHLLICMVNLLQVSLGEQVLI